MNTSLILRYIIWVGLLIAAAILYELGSYTLIKLTGVSLPEEVIGMILPALLLLSAYLLSLKNRYFLSALWVLSILSTSSVVLYVFLFAFGDIAFGITFFLYLIALIIHNYFFWGKTKKNELNLNP